MIQVPEDRRPPLTPQLAFRVAVLGGFALTMFAIIFFRLWYLQVLSGDQYVREASVNRVRDIAIAAPRGDILDRSGNILVDSKQAIQVQLSPPDLPVAVNPGNIFHPPARDLVVYRRLSGVLHISAKPGRCPVGVDKVRVKGRVRKQPIIHRLAQIPCAVAQQVYLLPFANVKIKTDVSADVRDYLAERQDQFPGVEVAKVYQRQYPLGDVAAQLFGTVGPINSTEVKLARYKGVSENAIIGQSGLEYYYDRYLRGIDGANKVQVDALGRFTRTLKARSPVSGHNLELSLDVNLQRAGQQALAQAIASNPPSAAGAFVALNPQNGQIYAMGSEPSFDPNIFTKPIPKKVYDSKFGAAQNYPLIDRAIQSGYPTGSTFKAITATAALQSGVWSTGQTYDDTGTYTDGPGDTRHNAGHLVDGVLDITHAIMVSSDDFFYNLGRLLNLDVPRGGALQRYAHDFGIGRSSGVDIGGENNGILPTPAWRAGRDQLEAQCDNATGQFKGKAKHAAGGCGIADGRPWSVGDNENLAVGQGDLEATPLQLAVAYAAIENNGTVVRPHVGLAVTNAQGTVLQRINPPATRHIPFNENDRAAILQGLRDAASVPGGTSADVFGNFPEQVYGKTGTAQHNNQADQAWYVCFVPSWATGKPIEIVVTVEQGGFGAIAAAPVARQMLSEWFFGKKGAYVAGTSKTL